MDEWDLLCGSEDIERGDNILVEDDSGEEEIMVYVKHKNGKVYLRDCLSRIAVFCAATLEEIDGYRYILGRAD